MVKNLLANTGDIRDVGLIPGPGKIPCMWAWYITPIFLPGESHGQRSLEGYSPKSHRELDKTAVTFYI